MSLSHLIEEFVDMKIEGEPPSREWRSINECAREREEWHSRLQRIRDQIDEAVKENT